MIAQMNQKPNLKKHKSISIFLLIGNLMIFSLAVILFFHIMIDPLIRDKIHALNKLAVPIVIISTSFNIMSFVGIIAYGVYLFRKAEKEIHKK